MNVIKMAQAIVRFRLLRSLGSFEMGHEDNLFYFHMESNGKDRREKLANGVPTEVENLTIRDLVQGYDSEIGQLCWEHFNDDQPPS